MSSAEPFFSSDKKIQEILEGKGYQPRNVLDPKDFEDLFEDDNDD
ncbi:hypothetical protein [Glutamicibacter sp. X7]